MSLPSQYNIIHTSATIRIYKESFITLDTYFCIEVLYYVPTRISFIALLLSFGYLLSLEFQCFKKGVLVIDLVNLDVQRAKIASAPLL